MLRRRGRRKAAVNCGFQVESDLAGAIDFRSFVRLRSACRRSGGRAAAVPPFSGPRSRAAVADCNPQPHHHRGALQPWGATANRACARGHHHRPDASGVACHAVACHPGAGAGGLGYGRRHHSRWPRPAHEQTLLMARRLRTENGAPRAWAGERAPGHLPLLYACTQPAAKVSNWPITAGPPDAGLIDARHGRTAGVSSGMPAARCIRYSSSAVSSSLPKA